MQGDVKHFIGSLLEVKSDVIVNAANASLLGGGGVDGVIHAAAGPALKEACRPLAPCPTGGVRVTDGFGLGDVMIFHTVGPIWKGGNRDEGRLLKACYENCLRELVARGKNSIVFPAISTGAYAFPPDDAAQIAVETCKAFAEHEDVLITLATLDKRNTPAIRLALQHHGLDQ